MGNNVDKLKELATKQDLLIKSYKLKQKLLDDLDFIENEDTVGLDQWQDDIWNVEVDIDELEEEVEKLKKVLK